MWLYQHPFTGIRVHQRLKKWFYNFVLQHICYKSIILAANYRRVVIFDNELRN